MMKITALALMLLTTGCAMARGQHELFPTANMMPPAKVRTEAVQLYRDGAMPESGCFKVAKLAAHGNGYANAHTLEEKLQDEAADIGAESVIVLGSQVNNGMTVGTYGGGIAMGSTIQYPSMYGIACRTPQAFTGARTGGKDKDFIVEYVTKGSAADEAGLIEGDKLLTINGRFVADDPFLWEKEIYARTPGEQVTIEYLRGGKKQSTVLRLMPPRLTANPKNLASPYYSK